MIVNFMCQRDYPNTASTKHHRFKKKFCFVVFHWCSTLFSRYFRVTHEVYMFEVLWLMCVAHTSSHALVGVSGGLAAFSNVLNAASFFFCYNNVREVNVHTCLMSHCVATFTFRSSAFTLAFSLDSAFSTSCSNRTWTVCLLMMQKRLTASNVSLMFPLSRVSERRSKLTISSNTYIS